MLILFFVFGVAVVPCAAYLYMQSGHPPVAVADPMFPMEEQMARSVLHARIERERPGSDPVPFNEPVLKQGAAVYMSECSFCHGTPSGESQIGVNTFPKTPQFFKAHPGGNRAQDVARRAASFHWYIDNGVRLTAMPSYKNILADNDQWAVANLLANREQPLPESVTKILAGETE